MKLFLLWNVSWSWVSVCKAIARSFGCRDHCCVCCMVVLHAYIPSLVRANFYTKLQSASCSAANVSTEAATCIFFIILIRFAIHHSELLMDPMIHVLVRSFPWQRIIISSELAVKCVTHTRTCSTFIYSSLTI